MSRRVMLLPRYVVPVRPRGAVWENHAVVIEGDCIAAVGPEGRVGEDWQGAEIIRLRDHVLLPGLINVHTHSPMTLLRGFADDLDLQCWLNDRIWPAERRHVNRDFVADGTRLAMAEMIRGGTTCFNDNYFHPGTMAEVAVQAGMRAGIGLPLLEQATPWARNFGEYLERGLTVLRKFGDQPLLTITLAPHAPYSVTDSSLARIAGVSRDRDLRIHMHCLETRFDIEHSMREYGVPPLKRLAAHELLNDRLIAVHMTQLEDADIRLIAETGVHVVHCPQSNLKLASGICRVNDLMAAGVNLSIGTDGAASNNNLDLLEEVRFAALLAKGASQNARVPDAMQALETITINGAMALGLDDAIGTIEPGKQADLCAFNLASPQTQPVYDVVSQIIYSASSSQCSDVWVAGRRLMAEGVLLTLDEDRLLAVADSWRARLHDDTAIREAPL